MVPPPSTRRVSTSTWWTHSFGADTQKPTRIFELNVGDLSPVRRSRSSAYRRTPGESIAVGGPDDDVFVTLVPQTAHDDSFVQVYRPDGTFLRQFAVAPSTDVAVNAHGDVFLGGTHGFGMHGADGTGRKGIGDAAGVFGVSVDGSDEVFGIESTAKRASIVKFVPQVPQTRIVDAPPPGLTELKDTPTVTFKFKSSTPSSTFECRLERRGFDTVPFAPCSDPQTFPNTPNGTYRLDVRAVSSDGAPDPTPASVRFKVRVVYAHAHITSHPAKLSALTTATFTFTSSTPGATFKCRLTPYLTAPAAFKPCASPVAYPGLTHDLYTFQVEAITTDGFTEPNADSFTFAVDPVAPHVSTPVAKIMPVQQVGPLGETAVTWGWSATDPNTPTKQLLDTLQGTRLRPSLNSARMAPPGPGGRDVGGHPDDPGAFYQFQALARTCSRVGAGPARAPCTWRRSTRATRGELLQRRGPGINDTDAVGATVAKAVTAGKATLSSPAARSRDRHPRAAARGRERALTASAPWRAEQRASAPARSPAAGRRSARTRRRRRGRRPASRPSSSGDARRRRAAAGQHDVRAQPLAHDRGERRDVVAGRRARPRGPAPSWKSIAAAGGRTPAGGGRRSSCSRRSSAERGVLVARLAGQRAPAAAARSGRAEPPDGIGASSRSLRRAISALVVGGGGEEAAALGVGEALEHERRRARARATNQRSSNVASYSVSSASSRNAWSSRYAGELAPARG